MSDDIIAEAIGPLPFPTFWRIDEVARLLAIEAADVRRMISTHQIPAFWIGSEYRLATKDLIAWLVLERSAGGNRHERPRRRRANQA